MTTSCGCIGSCSGLAEQELGRKCRRQRPHASRSPLPVRRVRHRRDQTPPDSGTSCCPSPVTTYPYASRAVVDPSGLWVTELPSTLYWVAVPSLEVSVRVPSGAICVCEPSGLVIVALPSPKVVVTSPLRAVTTIVPSGFSCVIVP